MIEVIILTSSKKGSASVHLAELIKSKKIFIKAVILNEGIITNKKRMLRRKAKKICRIGLLGALNGIRMRSWYSENVWQFIRVDRIENLCIQHKIPLLLTPSINSPTTVNFFSRYQADLGISLGNSYIGSKVFSVPKFGMLNIHHEQLPNYQNAQSIIWQLYNNSPFSGYTIHKIDKSIDTGDIIYQEQLPIVFRNTLKETVSFNYAKLWEISSRGLLQVLEDFPIYFESSSRQEKGNVYTTPTLKQFVTIYKNYRRMKAGL